jgi:hypothetical protein
MNHLLDEQRRLAGLPEIAEKRVPAGSEGDVWERVVKAMEDAEKELHFPKEEWESILRIKKLLEVRKARIVELRKDKDIESAAGRNLNRIWAAFQNAIVSLDVMADKLNDADNELLHLSTDVSRSIAARPASGVPWEAD